MGEVEIRELVEWEEVLDLQEASWKVEQVRGESERTH